MTSAAQMSSNISISIGPCLIRSVDDYWHNIYVQRHSRVVPFGVDVKEYRIEVRMRHISFSLPFTMNGQ